jgi:hypothetical protein
MRSVVRAVRRIARTHVDEGEKFAAAASIAGEGAPFEVQKPIFYWVFRDGTALADQSMWK